MDGTIRTFIAIDLSDEMINSIQAIQSQLKKSGADVRWSKPKNCHITIKFIGDTLNDSLDDIATIISGISGRFSPFEFTYGELGAFPHIKNPRVIWIGVTDASNSTKNIACELNEKLAGLRIEKETKPFHPHITLGRTRSAFNKFALFKQIKNVSCPPLTKTVTHLTFYKSTLTSNGPLYEVIKKFALS